MSLEHSVWGNTEHILFSYAKNMNYIFFLHTKHLKIIYSFLIILSIILVSSLLILSLNNFTLINVLTYVLNFKCNCSNQTSYLENEHN